MPVIKTYKAVKPMKVGNEERGFGDLVPEAASWPNTAVYLRSNYLEEVFIDKNDFDDLMKSQAEKFAPKKKRVVRKKVVVRAKRS